MLTALISSLFFGIIIGSPIVPEHQNDQSFPEQRVGMCAMQNPTNWLNPSFMQKFFLDMQYQMMLQDYSGLPAGFAESLPRLKIDKSKVSVLGLSSGAFMAVQLHVAFSQTFKAGGASIAGGPFYCAEGNIMSALGRCMCHSDYIPVDRLVSTTRQWASQGHVDPVENLQESKAYIFAGLEDGTVIPTVSDDLFNYYQALMPRSQIQYKKLPGADHSLVTDIKGNPCIVNAPPYINNCGFDTAKEVFTFFYGTLNPRNDGALTGRLIKFDQTAFSSASSLSPVGYAYIPRSCSNGATCKLHVALHGCRQNADVTGAAFPTWSGFNQWADTNDIVVLYPQTGFLATNACWDWWGYESAYYSSKTGPQMQFIKKAVDHLSSGV